MNSFELAKVHATMRKRDIPFFATFCDAAPLMNDRTFEEVNELLEALAAYKLERTKANAISVIMELADVRYFSSADVTPWFSPLFQMICSELMCDYVQLYAAMRGVWAIKEISHAAGAHNR